MRPFTLDQWAPLNFIDAAMGDGQSRPPNVASWVPDDDARRIAAYWILAAIRENCRRYYLPDLMWNRPTIPNEVGGATFQVEAGRSPAEKYREYGDPALFVEQTVALLLGESQAVVVPDAAPLPDDASSEEQTAQTRAVEFDDWLQSWADVERLFLRLFEQEEDSVGLGDGVLVLGWDAENARPRLRKFDTESYFPVLSGDQDVDEFPNKVHFAWVECTPDGKEWLHRLTYERRRLPDGEVRRYRYAPDVKSPWTVYQTHAVWDLAYVDKGGVYDLTTPTRYQTAPPTAEFPEGRRVDDLDIGVDFLPVVHIPNTPAGSKHFGRSLFLSVAQLLDDLGFADSDLAASSELVGNAPLVVSGGSGGGALSRGPGAQYDLPAGGTAGFLDTSKLLDGQIGFVDHLLSRLSVNTRLAEALLGRVKPNEVPSGVALQLGFAPTKSLIGKMRLVRGEKHPLLLRFAMRFAQQFDVLPEGPTPRAEIRLGNYLPADKAAAVDTVKALLPAHGMSIATAVQTLIEAGFAVEDAQQEVERIKAEWLAAAVQLLEATGSEDAVAKWLGIDPAEITQPPAGQ
jgi:hypothetical protein